MLFKALDVQRPAVEDIASASALPILKQPSPRVAFSSANRLADLKADIGTPIQGTDLHFMTSGRFSMHELIAHLHTESAGAAYALYLATWSLCEDAARLIVELAAARPVWLYMDKRVRVRNPKPLQLCFQLENLALGATHAKVAIFAFEDGRHWSVVTSANMTANPRDEIGLVTASEAVGEFYKNWITCRCTELGHPTK